MVRSTRTQRFIGISELIHEEAEKVLFLFGSVSEKGEYECYRLRPYVGEWIEREGLRVLTSENTKEIRIENLPLVFVGWRKSTS